VVFGGEFGGNDDGNESRRLVVEVVMVVGEEGEGERGGGEMERNGEDSWRV
jgi:hypothetical protein